MVENDGHVATCLRMASEFSIEHTAMTPRFFGKKTTPVVRGAACRPVCICGTVFSN
jgi:hypothetical protein